MNYILSVSYANEQVTRTCYTNLAAQLYRTAKDFPCEVIVFDNRYPLNEPTMLPKLCSELGFMYQTVQQNIGVYHSYNVLLKRLPEYCQSVILMDGDTFVETTGWYKAATEVMKDESVATCLVSNTINQRELKERGFTQEAISGHNVKVSKEVICCTAGGWNVSFLRQINGITSPNKYYGGNEIEMWRYYQNRKLVVLDEYQEDLEGMKAMQDWQYEEYKLLYAHRGLNMSFEEYLNTNPHQFGRDVLIKEIFG